VGLLASIFGNGNSIKKNRQKNRNFRVCRVEEMESRDLLCATCWDAPDPIDVPLDPTIHFGIHFHDNTCKIEHQSSIDTFTVAWNGAADGTVLTTLVIDLSSANSSYNLYFKEGTFSSITGVTGVISDTTTLEDDVYGKKLTLTFDSDFTGDSLVFNVGVYRNSSGKPVQVTDGHMIEGATVEATFVKEGYYTDTIFEGKLLNEYPENPGDYGMSDIPQHDKCCDGTGNGATTAGMFASKQQESITGSLSGYVYHDKNNNGIKEEGEYGISGVKLALWIWDGEKYIPYMNGDAHYTATTNENGFYMFENLRANEQYKIVQVDQPEHYTDGKNTGGSLEGDEIKEGPDGERLDAIGGILLGEKANGMDNNFGEYKNGSLSGFVYHDENNDGIKDEDEEGIKDVTIELWVWDGESEKYIEYLRDGKHYTVTTGEDGRYEFTDVDAFKTYEIRQKQPEGWQDGKESVGSLGGTLPATDNDTIGGIEMQSEGKGENYNFGEYKNGSLSGFVYHDKNNNGIKEEGEEGIEGVELSLWVWNGTAYEDTGKKVFTDASGKYLFENVDAFKTYEIRQEQPEGWQDGKESVGSLGGTSPVTDNDTIGGIEMQSEGKGENYNFGEYKNGSLSGFVYHDKNNNGIKEEGEAGIADVTLELWVWDGEKYIKYLRDGEHYTVTTNEHGFYQFTDLETFQKTNPEEFQKYEIRQTQDHMEDGWQDGKESVGTLNGTFNGTLSANDIITDIVMRSDGMGEDYNFGEYKNGSLSGFVYHDRDNDGIKGSIEGEDGIDGVTLELWVWCETSEDYIPYERGGEHYTVTTDGSGFYEFTDLETFQKTNPEEFQKYEIRQTQDHMEDVWQDGKERIGSLGGKQSVNDTITDIVMQSDGKGENYNFGEYKNGSISGHVYFDENKDGERDPGEELEGKKVTLWGWDGGKYVQIDETTTDENGYYEFNVDPFKYDRYEVRVEETGSWRVFVGTVDGEKNGGDKKNAATNINFNRSEQRGEEYNFSIAPPPETPPPLQSVPVSPSAPPPFSLPPMPVGTGGPLVTQGVFGWQAASLTEPLRGGFGSGGVVEGAAGFSWQLSVINAGYPRANGATDGIAVGEHASQTTMLLSDSGNVDSGARYVSVAWAPLPMNQAGWFVKGKDGIVRKRFTFGPEGGIPVVGDFNGDGIADVAVYHNGNWYIDLNGNGKWDEEDLWVQMGGPTDQPVTGDWDGDGKTDIGVFGQMGRNDHHLIDAKPGLPTDLNTTISTIPKNMPPDVAINASMNNVRAMKHSMSGGVRLDVVDHVFQYGNEGDKAFAGDFNGDGIATIGVYRDGKWYIDKTGTGKWDENAVFVDNADFGLGSGGIPVIGDFNGDGIDKIGLYKDGIWYLDTTGDFRFDTRIEFGQAGDHPIVGDFDGSGIAQLAVYRAGSADLFASTAPEPIAAASEGMIARQFTGEVAEEDQGLLKNHTRSETTPHTNAPLLRGR